MSPIAAVLLLAAVVLVVATEWSRISSRLGTTRLSNDGRKSRARQKQKQKLTLVHPDSEEFARSVERDLAALPTIDEQDSRRR